MKKEEQILHELKTLSALELEEVLTFIGYLKFRSATSQEEPSRSNPLGMGDA